MANPIIAIVSVLSVAGAGAAAVAVNTEVVNTAAQSPVVVTVEGKPVIVGGGIETIIKKVPATSTNPGSAVGNAPVASQAPVQTVAPVQAPVQAAAPVQAPAPVVNTHTGASAVASNEGEREDSEVEDREVQSVEKQETERDD